MSIPVVTKDEIKQLFRAAVDPVMDRLRVIETDLAETKRLSGSGGRPFLFDGSSSHRRGPSADGLNLSAIIRSLQHGDKSLAPLAHDLSSKLEQCGYVKSDPRSILVPLGQAGLFLTRGHEALVEEIGTICKQAWPISVDRDELNIVRKQMSQKAPMDSLDDSLGGSFVALPAIGEPITALRAATVILQAGARSVPLPPQGSLQYPTTTGEPTLQWLGPNQAITESTVPSGSLTLSARKAAGLIKLPNELLRFGQGLAEAIIRESLVSRLARHLDIAALDGQGGTLSPLGITTWQRSVANTPTSGFVTLYMGAGVSTTLGNTFRPEDSLKMIALIEEANDQEGPTAWLMRPLFFAAVANKRADCVFTGDGAGAYLHPITRGELGGAVAKALSGLPVLTTTSISKTRTENNCAVAGLTYLVCGNFRQIFVGTVGVVELTMDSSAGYGSDQTWVRVIGHSDVGLAHPESFTIYDQLLIP